MNNDVICTAYGYYRYHDRSLNMWKDTGNYEFPITPEIKEQLILQDLDGTDCYLKPSYGYILFINENNELQILDIDSWHKHYPLEMKINGYGRPTSYLILHRKNGPAVEFHNPYFAERYNLWCLDGNLYRKGKASSLDYFFKQAKLTEEEILMIRLKYL